MKNLLLNHKKRYSMTNNPDSVWNRGVSGPRDTGGLGGKTVMQALGIEDEGPQSTLYDKEPIKMMDIVQRMWDEEEREDQENEVDKETS